jgi:K+-transporting ATPase ATPase A chain
MEGKETRFGIASSALFATITTASCGAVNAMHDSFTPLGGLVPLANMQLGEVVFGGVGTGLYGMLVFAILAVFIAGLMIGRTPEYLGKKIEAYEMKMSSIAILVTPAAGAARHRHRGDERGAGPASPIRVPMASRRSSTPSLRRQQQRQCLRRPVRQHPFYNVLLGIAMWFGRFGVIVPVLAMAGSLAAKKRIRRAPERCQPTARYLSPC